MSFILNTSILILVFVLALIAVRQIGCLKLQIWQIMLGGALSVLLTGQISLQQAATSINMDVMIFLAGMFIIGEALHESGYLLHLSTIICCKAKNLNHLLLFILFGLGPLSALLMNDTLAIIGTPLTLYFARMQNISPKILLLALAFALTTGSVMSPIGNPQNLLIATNRNLGDPFRSFLQYLFLPTVVNLLLAFLLIRVFYRDQFRAGPLQVQKEKISDPGLAYLSQISLLLLILLIIAKAASVIFRIGELGLPCIAIVSALPIVLFSPKRWNVIRRIDWNTLIFFAAMFVLMGSVWRSGLIQSFVESSNLNLTSIPTILALSVLISQLISNVPFVALFQPLLGEASIKGLMALAAGSTIAGNLFIMGAASNVIIIQNAEKYGETLSFVEFARLGVPLTILNILVYWLFLKLLIY